MVVGTWGGVVGLMGVYDGYKKNFGGDGKMGGVGWMIWFLGCFVSGIVSGGGCYE